MIRKEIEVHPKNVFYVEKFLIGIYGLPTSYGGDGKGIIKKSYQNVNLEFEKKFFERDYKVKIMVNEKINKSIKKELTNIAMEKELSPFKKLIKTELRIKKLSPFLDLGY